MSATGEEKAHGSGSETSSTHQLEIYERPRGWRGIYYHTATQVCLVGFVCFMCPGMFNALTGLGAGGQVDATSSANANAALYATFAFFAFFSGSVARSASCLRLSDLPSSVHNVLGPRLCLLLGTWGYSLYIASYLYVFSLTFLLLVLTQDRTVQRTYIPVQVTLLSSLEPC